MEIEQVKAEYINPDYGPRIVIPDWYIFRVKSGSVRWYGMSEHESMAEPVYAPGVTSILKATMPTPYGLMRWREQNGAMYCDWFMESSAAYGTWLHNIYGRLMRGEELVFSKEALMVDFMSWCQRQGMDWKYIERWVNAEGRNPQKDIYGFIKWFEDHKVQPIAIEYPLFVGGEMPYAGTIDLVCQMEIQRSVPGKRNKETVTVNAIVDFKTGMNSYESHAVQLEAYRVGWNQQNPELQIEETLNLLGKDYNLPLGKTALPYSLRRQTDSKAAKLWNNYLEMFHAQTEPFRPAQTTFTEGVVSLYKTQNIIVKDGEDEDEVVCVDQ